MLWGGNRCEKEDIAIETLPDGGTRVVFVYQFLKGCQACQLLGYAWFAFDFDRGRQIQRNETYKNKICWRKAVMQLFLLSPVLRFFSYHRRFGRLDDTCTAAARIFG